MGDGRWEIVNFEFCGSESYRSPDPQSSSLKYIDHETLNPES